jgi:serine/threonine protein kinase/tetratricopeptide (TPR) repeat protein
MGELGSRLQAALGDAYHIDRELSGGGMSRLFLATEVSLNRQVVVKVLPPELSGYVSAARFKQEIMVAANLQHPNILPVLTAGARDDLLFYVMPYVAGDSLRRRLAVQGKLPLGEAVRILQEIADALAFAHDHGVIHRDIKPENILLQGEHAVLTDFGVARAVRETRTGDPLTHTGLVVGTPGYMSPEQAAGERTIDARADIYALAVVGYEMLAGAPPFEGPSAQAIFAAHLTQEPTPLHQLRPEIPVELEEVVAKALAKQPAARFATAAQFREALGTGTGAWAAMRRPWAEHTGSVAVLPFVNMSVDPENEFFADGMTEDIINALTKVERLHVASRTSAFAYKGLNQDVRKVGRQLNVDTVLEGSVRKVGARLRITAQLVTVADGYHVWSEHYDREMGDVFAIQDEIARAIVTALKIRLGEPGEAPLVKRQTDNVDAYSHFVKGRYFLNQRGVGLAKALEYFAQAIAEDPGYAAAYAGLADAHTLLAWYGFVAPRDALPKAKAAALRSLEIDPLLGEGYTSLGYVKLHWDWDWTGAERDFRQAVEILGGHAPTHQWYSEYLTAVGRVQEALEEAQRAQVLEPLGLIITTRLGDAWYCVRNYERAIQECRRAIEMDPTFVPAHVWLGLACLQSGMVDDAVRVFENARALPGASPSLALACLGLACGWAGKTDDATDILQQLEDLAQRRYVSSFDIALVWLGLRRTDQALALLERAAEERACWLPRLPSDPVFDGLRAEQRFHRLLGTMGLAATPLLSS